jgi:CRP/FNR family transcriptional regulator
MAIRSILIEFFPDIEEEELMKFIADNAKITKLKENEIVMDYGSRVAFIPLLFEGKIKIYKEDEEGNELFLYYIHPGQACAVSFSCFDKLSAVIAQ